MKGTPTQAVPRSNNGLRMLLPSIGPPASLSRANRSMGSSSWPAMSRAIFPAVRLTFDSPSSWQETRSNHSKSANKKARRNDTNMKQVINTLEGREAPGQHAGISRRKALLSGGGLLAAATTLKPFDATAAERGGTTPPNLTNAGRETGMITTKDGAEIFFKDWGSS